MSSSFVKQNAGSNICYCQIQQKSSLWIGQYKLLKLRANLFPKVYNKIGYKRTHLFNLTVYSVFASALWTSGKQCGPCVSCLFVFFYS